MRFLPKEKKIIKINNKKTNNKNKIYNKEYKNKKNKQKKNKKGKKGSLINENLTLDTKTKNKK